MTEPTDNLELLPPWLRAMARDIGLRDVLRLAQARGGRRVYVPQELSSQTLLVRIAGRRAAAWLAERFPNEHLAIPRCADYVRGLRNAEIVARWQAGESEYVLAVEYQLTDRMIRYILRGAGVTVDDRQSSMF